MAMAQTALTRRVSAPRVAAVAPIRPVRCSRVTCKASWLMDVAAGAPGSVDAPIGVLIGGAIVVTLASTLVIPLWLKPGQEAAEKIFEAKQKNPLNKKK